MPSLSDVPVEVLLDNVLPSVAIRDLLNLSCTSRFFSILCADDTFWKRKLQSDFNFSGAGTARTSGWKFIYKGIRNPRVFVWGNQDHGRLGLTHLPRMGVQGCVPFPVELRFPGIRVVSIAAGGMSFHALDADGHLYVWGTLDGNSYALTSDGFSEPGKQAPHPMRLALPTRTRSVSCGRLHLTTLDDTGNTWTFLSWGRPFRLVSPLLDNTTPESTPLQVECGWAFSSVLTKSGDVFVFWPFVGEMHTRIAAKNAELDLDGDKKANVDEDVIPCITWDLHINPSRLPDLPPLPEILNTNKAEDADEKIRLIRIAAFDNNIIGLTNKGHVLKYGHLNIDTAVPTGQWKYLPNFSEVERVRQHPTFVSQEGSTSDINVEPPQRMQITHISAHFEHFIAYSTGSSSIVIMGSTNTTDASEPTIIPALQNKSVISVVLGDYHYGALTADGKLLTWGQYSRGALGLGDPTKLELGSPGGFPTGSLRHAAFFNRSTPPSVEVPTEVRFDHGLKKKRERFCFAATAAGWHMGALVIDLEDGDSEEEEENSDVGEGPTQPMPGQFPHALPQHPFTPHGPGEVPILPTGRGLGAFRIGFAGRGLQRGRGGAS